MFWPESDTTRARAALRKSLYVLRQSLGGDVIVSRGDDEIGVDRSKLHADVYVFEEALSSGRCAEALEAYAGDLLEGFYFEGASNEFETWLDGERSRLKKLAAEAAWSVSVSLESSGDLSGSIRSARRAFGLAPPSDAELRRLLALLDRAGDRAAALRAYGKYVEWIRDEYDADPSPETVALAEAIRSRGESDAAGPVLGPHHSHELALSESASADVRPPAQAGSRRWHRVGVLAAVLVAASAIPVLLALRSPHLVDDRVLVLAFENRTGDGDLDAVGDMAADWISRGISETGIAQVVPAASIPDETGNPIALADRFGARMLVSGSYYRQGDSLYLGAQVTDAGTARVLRSIGPIAVPEGDVLRGANELRATVLGTLASQLDASYQVADVTRQPPRYDAYRAFIEGERAFRRALWDEALRHYYRASALDSGYNLPLVLAAVTHFNAGQCALTDSLAAVLEPRRDRMSLYEAYYVDRSVAWCHGDWNAAYRAAVAMAESTPRSVHAQNLAARSALFINRPREAVDRLLAISEGMDVVAAFEYYRDLTVGYHMLGEHQRELELALISRERQPDVPQPLGFVVRAAAALGDTELVDESVGQALAMTTLRVPVIAEILRKASDELLAHGHPEEARDVAEREANWLQRRAGAGVDTDSLLAQALYRAGRYEEAGVIMNGLASEYPDSVRYLAAKGRIAARLGDVGAAKAVSDSLASLELPYLRGSHTYGRAQIAAILGDKEQAVELLSDAIAEGRVYSWSAGFFDDDPDFQTLRSFPPYQEILRPKG